MCRSRAISFNPFQNASSRLTLVLWPANTIERLKTRDFMKTPPFVINSTAQPFPLWRLRRAASIRRLSIQYSGVVLQVPKAAVDALEKKLTDAQLAHAGRKGSSRVP